MLYAVIYYNVMCLCQNQKAIKTKKPKSHKNKKQKKEDNKPSFFYTHYNLQLLFSNPPKPSLTLHNHSF